jgi:hypothetical protein
MKLSAAPPPPPLSRHVNSFSITHKQYKGETVFPNGIAINDGLTDEIDGVYVRDVAKEESELQADWQKRIIARDGLSLTSSSSSSSSEDEDEASSLTGDKLEALRLGAVNDRVDGLFAAKTWQVDMLDLHTDLHIAC